MIVNIRKQKFKLKSLQFFLFIEILVSTVTNLIYSEINLYFIVKVYHFINIIFLKVDKHNQRILRIFLISVNNEFSI